MTVPPAPRLVEVTKYGASWCGPCKMMTDEKGTWTLAKQRYVGQGVTFTEVDIDAQPALAQEAGVRSIPTIQFHLVDKRGRQLVQVATGFQPYQKFAALLDHVLTLARA